MNMPLSITLGPGNEHDFKSLMNYLKAYIKFKKNFMEVHPMIMKI